MSHLLPPRLHVIVAMEEDVDIPVSATVVIVDSEDAERFHRPPVLPWREVACVVGVTADTKRMPRLEAERRGYEPCLCPDCFGKPE